MSNKPTNVVEHEHYFVHPEDEFHGRVDACLLEDGSAVVWIVPRDEVMPFTDYEDAKRVAQSLVEKERLKVMGETGDVPE